MTTTESATPLTLTVQATAELIGCSRDTVTRLLELGLITEADSHGLRRRFINRASVEAYVAGQPLPEFSPASCGGDVGDGPPRSLPTGHESAGSGRALVSTQTTAPGSNPGAA